MASVARPRSIWILGAGPDLVLIIGTPVIIFAGFLVANQLWSPAVVSSFVMIWAIGHHLPGMMRAYGDPELFRRFWIRFPRRAHLSARRFEFCLYHWREKRTAFDRGDLGLVALFDADLRLRQDL